MLSRRHHGHQLDTPVSRWDTLFRPWSTTVTNPYWDRDFDMAAVGEGGVGGGFGWMNSFEADNGDVLVTVDMPGVKKEDISVSHEHGVLNIRGKRRIVLGGSSASKAQDDEEKHGENGEKDKKETTAPRSESVSEVSRCISVPKGFDVENIKAKLEEGVLTLTIPKKPEEKPLTHRITID